MEFKLLFITISYMFAFIGQNIAPRQPLLISEIEHTKKVLDKALSLKLRQETNTSEVEMLLANNHSTLWPTTLCTEWRGIQNLVFKYDLKTEFLLTKNIRITPTHGRITNNVVILRTMKPKIPIKQAMLECNCKFINDDANKEHKAAKLYKAALNELEDANQIPRSNICVNGSKIYISRGLKGRNSFYLYALYKPAKDSASSSTETPDEPEEEAFIVISHLQAEQK